MGIAELIALGSLGATVAGGVWGSYQAVNNHLSAVRSDLEVLKFRLLSVEKVLNSNRLEGGS